MHVCNTCILPKVLFKPSTKHIKFLLSTFNIDPVSHARVIPPAHPQANHFHRSYIIHQLTFLPALVSMHRGDRGRRSLQLTKNEAVLTKTLFRSY